MRDVLSDVLSDVNEERSDAKRREANMELEIIQILTHCFAPRLAFAHPPPPQQPSDMVISDFTGDSYPDIVFIAEASDAIYLIEGNNQWTSRDSTNPLKYILNTGNAPYNIKACDLDADGDMDLVYTLRLGDSIKILANNGGTNTFATFLNAVGGG